MFYVASNKKIISDNLRQGLGSSPEAGGSVAVRAEVSVLIINVFVGEYLELLSISEGLCIN